MASEHIPAPARRSLYGLDGLNFFIADVQTAFGPFVAVYLASMGWQSGDIGLVIAAGGIVGVVSQAPGGALTDWIPAKRVMIGAALGLIAAGALVIAFDPRFWPVISAELLHGATGGMIRPALAALALGLVGHRALSRRLGRNQGFKSLGNAATAGLMGVLGQYASNGAPFLVAAALCIPAALALLMIRAKDIDYAEARSAADRANPRKGHRLRDAARNRHLQVFILSLVLFQVANAPLALLASGRLAYQHAPMPDLLTAAVVVIPESVAAAISVWIAARSDDWGRKPLLVLGLMAVALRSMLLALTANPWALLAFQALDGISAAVIGVMLPLVIADLTRGTGRYNFAQGVAGTAMGIGAAIAIGVTGYAVAGIGYSLGFLLLTAIALLDVAVLLWGFSEPKPGSVRDWRGWLRMPKPLRSAK
ncbi:MAG TPA: MFS transporter [Stellaceae bacterium]|nr:MFS transporter [Stellaceae bacterium]